MIEERHLKKIIIAVCVFILLIPIGFIIFINIVFYSGTSHDTIKTVLGDKFEVDYDHYKCDSTVTCKDSDLYWHYGGSISEDDFIPLEHTDSLTVYELKSSFIFNDGSGFMEFDDKTIDAHPEVAEIVKGKLLSDYSNFTSNVRFFLKSSKYKKETEQMIERIRQKKYDELEEYGLTEDVINDRTTVKLLEYEMSHPRYDR
ncbi:MAG: hypothetical protein K6F27_11770 [Ruminococcus sp.]|nr:hypothetical protein [Ruminococcus sp.]